MLTLLKKGSLAIFWPEQCFFVKVRCSLAVAWTGSLSRASLAAVVFMFKHLFLLKGNVSCLVMPTVYKHQSVPHMRAWEQETV